MDKNITTIVISNEALHSIEHDSNFGKNLANAIKANHISGKQIDVQALCHIRAATVVEQHDQDELVLVTVGSNYGNVYSETDAILEHHSDDAKLHILRDIAYRMGYFLRRRTDLK